MFTYAPNISWLFPELPFAERPRAVAQAGFKALEFGFSSHADIDAIAAAQDEFGLEVVLFNQDVPVWDADNRGYLSDPSRRDEFRFKLDESLSIAQRIRSHKVMLPAGVVLPEVGYEAQHACLLENLRYAAPLAAEVGVLLTLEMLNPRDNPGYFLTSSQEGISIVRELDSPHVRFQFDTYHIQLMEGNLLQTLTEDVDAIGHIQFADVPGRHEPGTGGLDFAELIQTITELGYTGYIGLEYTPLAQGAAALAWCNQSAPPADDGAGTS